MELYFVPKKNIVAKEIFLDDEEVHHIYKVIRKREGDVIHITEGEGTIYTCRIESIDKKRIRCSIQDMNLYPRNSPSIKFIIPLLKNPGRFDFMLEKLTELGIDEFLPFRGDNTFDVPEKYSRWKKILITAIKQSNNPYLPRIQSVKTFEDIINCIDLATSNIFYGNMEGQALHSLDIEKFKNKNLIYLTVGPESDYSQKESMLLKEFGAVGVKISNHRLRSETAAISLTSLIATSV